MEKYTISIQHGALMDAPVYQTHSRGKNWFATIKPNPTAPAGLDRKFHEKGKGDYYYLLPAFRYMIRLNSAAIITPAAEENRLRVGMVLSFQ